MYILDSENRGSVRFFLSTTTKTPHYFDCEELVQDLPRFRFSTPQNLPLKAERHLYLGVYSRYSQPVSIKAAYAPKEVQKRKVRKGLDYDYLANKGRRNNPLGEIVEKLQIIEANSGNGKSVAGKGSPKLT